MYDRFNRTPRETFTGDWVCSKCGCEIHELPFQPATDADGKLRPLYCKECYRLIPKKARY